MDEDSDKMSVNSLDFKNLHNDSSDAAENSSPKKVDKNPIKSDNLEKMVVNIFRSDKEIPSDDDSEADSANSDESSDDNQDQIAKVQHFEDLEF